MYRIAPISHRYASEIAGWIYPAEYAVYSFQKDSDTVNELMNGAYFTCVDDKETLIGYYCFGRSAQIPITERNVYSSDRLDIGLGLKPELCGRGLGTIFMETGMTYAKEHLTAAGFRLTVACFNKRAVNVYTKLGFAIAGEVTHQKSKARFYVMVT